MRPTCRTLAKGRLKEVGIPHCVMQTLAHPLSCVRHREWHAHHGEILGLALADKARPRQNTGKPGRSRREPRLEPFNRIAWRNVTEQHADGIFVFRIEQRVAPQQTAVAYAKNTPSDEAPPFADGDHERARLGTLEI